MSDRPSNGGSAGYCGGDRPPPVYRQKAVLTLRRQSGHRVHPIWASRRKRGVVTASQTVKASTATRRRPRDRRAQILHNASELFTKYGFHAVRMEDIAEATDVTARAIYRHFANKQDLLSQVVLEDQDRLLMAAQSAERSETGVCSLEELLTRMVEASLESLRLGPPMAARSTAPHRR